MCGLAHGFSFLTAYGTTNKTFLTHKPVFMREISSCSWISKIFWMLVLYSFALCWMGHFMRKPVLAICEQQRCRSARASAQSDQHICCSLPRYNTFSFYIQNFKTLARLCSWVGRFESYLVANPEGRFSRDEARMYDVISVTGTLDCRWLRSKLLTL